MTATCCARERSRTKSATLDISMLSNVVKLLARLSLQQVTLPNHARRAGTLRIEVAFKS